MNYVLELLPSVNFRNRLIVVNNRLISINRMKHVNLLLNMALGMAKLTKT